MNLNMGVNTKTIENLQQTDNESDPHSIKDVNLHAKINKVSQVFAQYCISDTVVYLNHGQKAGAS